MTNNTPITQTSVSLGPFERNIVADLAAKKGLNFSVSLRMIIREWHEAKIEQQRIRLTDAGREALHATVAIDNPASDEPTA